MASTETPPSTVCHVVAIPYPGRGHVNPMMNLCKRLAAGNSIVTFVVTEEWLGFIGSEPRPRRVRLATIPNVLPSELGRAADFSVFIRAVMTKMEAPFEQLLDRLDSPPPSVIIADTALFWAVNVGNRRNIPVASLWPMSAMQFSVFYHFHLLERHGHFPVDLSEKGKERVEYIPGLPSTSLVEILGTSGGKYDYIMEKFLQMISFASKAQYLLLASLHELETSAIDVLKSELPIPVYPVGSLIPCFEPESNSLERDRPDYIRWLDQQPEYSVLYVSLGSFLAVSSAQMDEIVAGLVRSGVRFMLVGRLEAKRLKECCGDKGLVVSWCEQLRVLSHSSIGGFWSHCGWNSVKEGILSGVPFLTFPIAADQFLNAKAVVDDWKIGWRVKKDLTKEYVATRDEIAAMVRKFMDGEEDQIREMRHRANELKEVFRRRGLESAESNVTCFLDDIVSTDRLS